MKQEREKVNFGLKTVLILDVKRAEAVEENGGRGGKTIVSLAYQTPWCFRESCQ